MSLADRLAAARESRGGDLQDVREPGEGLPDVDHTVPPPVSPVASAAAAADATRAGKRRADVPPDGGATAPAPAAPTAPAPRATTEPPKRVNVAQQERIEELKSSVHLQLLQ